MKIDFFKGKAPESVPRRDIEDALTDLEMARKRLEKELARRETDDEFVYGYPTWVMRDGHLETVYATAKTQREAYEVAIKEMMRTHGVSRELAAEEAPYRVVKVYI